MQEDRRSNVGGYTPDAPPTDEGANPPSSGGAQDLHLRAKSMRQRETAAADGVEEAEEGRQDDTPSA